MNIHFWNDIAIYLYEKIYRYKAVINYPLRRIAIEYSQVLL